MANIPFDERNTHFGSWQVHQSSKALQEQNDALQDMYQAPETWSAYMSELQTQYNVSGTWTNFMNQMNTVMTDAFANAEIAVDFAEGRDHSLRRAATFCLPALPFVSTDETKVDSGRIVRLGAEGEVNSSGGRVHATGLRVLCSGSATPVYLFIWGDGVTQAASPFSLTGDVGFERTYTNFTHKFALAAGPQEIVLNFDLETAGAGVTAAVLFSYGISSTYDTYTPITASTVAVVPSLTVYASEDLEGVSAIPADLSALNNA